MELSYGLEVTKKKEKKLGLITIKQPTAKIVKMQKAELLR